MSQDPSFITKLQHNARSSGYNNNPFSATGSVNHNTNILNNSNSFNTSKNNYGNISITDDRSEILTWLSPLEPSLRHYGIQVLRVGNVGDWVLRADQFRSWHSGHADGQGGSQKAALFCYGNPGVGKTYISSLVIDRLCDEAQKGDIAVACFYFDFAVQKEQSAASTLGALLRQIVSGSRQIPEEILDAFQGHKKVIGGRRLQLAEIVRLLGNLSSSRPTFFCLDALDECAAGERAKVLFSLRDVVKMSPTTRVFLTGRPHVCGEVERHLPGRAAFLLIIPRKDDIIQYINAKLAEDTTSDEMDKRLEAEIVKKIPEAIAEIFLLVALNLNAILQETTIHRRRERLRVLTDGLSLGDAYGATLGRIKAQGGQKSRLGMAALMWICHSQRPLRAEELCQALAIEIGSTDYNPDNVSSIQTVLSCCQGLVVVDKEGSIARLIHYTLQEYLTSHSGLFRSPHATIAEKCLTYLNSQQVIALSGSHYLNTQDTHFLAYSALYWGSHMKKELSDHGKTLAVKLFNCYRRHISIKLLLENAVGRNLLPDGTDFSKFTGLHYASMFGLVEVAKALTEMEGVDINSTDDVGTTPLIWASRNGHETVVVLLLGMEGVNPDMPDTEWGRAPISWAAMNGHEAVVKLFLGRGDINPDKPDTNSGRTPISWAAGNGHGAVAKLLLGREDVNPDRPDTFLGRTPISWAAGNGHDAVVKLFLEREDINPDSLDTKWGRTPIWWAAQNGHEAVTKLFLGREDVDSDRPDTFWGRTPISWAAGNGHKAVVKLFLERGEVNPDRPDTFWGRTPISWAAGNGHRAVVGLFLEWQDINPDSPDTRSGRTPILWAAMNGHEAVVGPLLGREDVGPDRPDTSWGRTPISWAAGNGHEAVVKLFLGREDVNPDRPDTLYGRTPISWAAENGHEAVVKLFLGQEDTNLNRPDI